MFAQNKRLVLQNRNLCHVAHQRTFSEAAHVLGTIVPGTLNVSHKINELRSRKLHLNESNPICIIKNHIYNDLNRTHNGVFEMVDNFNEAVTVQQNFEDLLIPMDHPSRSLTDTYYVDENTVLRPHTSAHQTEMYRRGSKAFLIVGDCYRKDTIDATHYPIFHQMEGARLWKKTEMSVGDVEQDLKQTLNNLVEHLFPGNPYRWNADYFPFTDPSFEMEVKLDAESDADDESNWLEIFGSGVIHQDILNNCGLEDEIGWAFGLGLERLAMRLFGIYDIRQFWSTDPRFLEQYADGKIKAFVPYSKYPICYKDISFWIHDAFHMHDFMDIVRNMAGDIVENVQLLDEFKHPKNGKVSHCYRVSYRHNDRTLTNEEVNEIQDNVRNAIESQLSVEIRG